MKLPFGTWMLNESKKYGTELCDQRALWKQYQKANNLEPKQLLRDGVHLNADGHHAVALAVAQAAREILG